MLIIPTLLTAPTATAQEAAASPDANAADAGLVGRKDLFIVGASVMRPFTDWTVKALQQEYEMPDPIQKLKGSTPGIRRFCAGVGAEYPDIVGTSRPMRKDEFEDCVANGVLDIIEVRIGESAIVPVVKKGEPAFNVTPRMLYLALAAEIPKNGDFKPNTVKNWNETTKDKSVPALPIEVVLPSKRLGQRGLFDDRFLQGGCRHVPEIDAIFGAEERVQKCVKIRPDVVKEIKEPLEQTTLAAAAAAVPGTIVITDLLIYKQNTDKLTLLPVSGIPASHESIDNYSYVAVNPLIYYFKRAHMRDKEGRGVVKGLREFMAMVVTEDAVGTNGAFAKMGLEPFNEEELAVFRTNVRRLRRYER